MTPIAPLVWVVFVASFLFGLGYGVSFLMPPLFKSFGADEAAVGTVLGVAVLLAGHVADAIGRARAIAIGGVGIGWGLFYCLSQIIIALLIPAAERARYFLISHAFIMGAVMTGLAAVECLTALARHLATRRAPAPLTPSVQEER
jgi:MFS family permease